MKTGKKLAVLLITAIGVLRSTTTTTRGTSTSTMGMPTTPIRTPHTMCVRFGLLNNLTIQQFDNYKTHIARRQKINQRIGSF